MRLLFTTSASPLRLNWPDLADIQVACGPLHLDWAIEGQVLSCRTPAGPYDLAEIIGRMPDGQKPDVIACVVDGSTVDLPRNLAACPGRKVLLVGDSQTRGDGLGRILDYARAEPFERIILTHGCLDEPCFIEAGFGNVFWFPGLLCQVRDWILPIVRHVEKTKAVVSPRASTARYSALNVRLGALSSAGVTVEAWDDSPELRLEAMAHAKVVVVPSERGEWPSALFEALAVGSRVVVSDLGEESGVERLWPEGCPFVALDDPDQSAGRIAQWAEGSETPGGEGAAAMAWFDRFLGDQPRRRAFEQLVFEGIPVVPKREGVTSGGPPRSSLVAACELFHLALATRARPSAWIGEDVPESYRWLARRFPRLAVACGSLGRQGDFDLVISVRGEDAAAGAFAWVLDGQILGEGRTPWLTVPGVSAASAVVEMLELHRAAWEALEEGDYSKALELATQELAVRPRSVEGNLIIADLFLEGKQLDGYERHRKVVWAEALHDPRVDALVKRAELSASRTLVRRSARGWSLYGLGDLRGALEAVAPFVARAPALLALQFLEAHLLTASGKTDAAIESWDRAARFHPNDDSLWFNLGLAYWQAGRRKEGTFGLLRAFDHAPHERGYARAFESVRRAEPLTTAPQNRSRNLVVSVCENNGKHGVGVLVRRFFTGMPDTITLRAATSYGGTEEVGSAHFWIPGKDIPRAELETRVRRLLAPYTVQRILSIPHTKSECLLALAAHTVTQAKLCTYVMDDRSVLTAETDEVYLEALFKRSSLKLVISSEMQEAYAIKYDYDFDVMPPIVVNREARRTNRWNPKEKPATQVALVGNVWTLNQFLALLQFVRRSQLTVDWFGNPPTFDLSRTGINLMGFLPEDVLADKIVEYPLVLVPSGMLNGTEDNEWLTRLSLPSRLVFLLQTAVPVLVLGSPHTCAARYVTRLGLGRVMPYNHPNPVQEISEMLKPATRATFLANAGRAADGFVMPNAGAWIWASTDAGRAQPAPFDPFVNARPEMTILWPPEHAGAMPISHVELQPA